MPPTSPSEGWSPGHAATRYDALDLSGERVLITGGAGALAETIRTTLEAHGARILSMDLADGPGGDATAPDAVDAAIARAHDELGGTPTIGLCHAGVVRSGALADLPISEFDLIMSSNLKSAYVTARQLSRRWISDGQPGHLIFTASWVATQPWPDIGAYNASKAGIVQLMRSFAVELAPHRIRSNAIAPGIVNAGMARMQWDTEPEYRRRASHAIPLGEMQPVQSVADSFLFLCSGLASYMDGAVLTVDGGASLRPLD